jgi:hypothetical protein
MNFLFAPFSLKSEANRIIKAFGSVANAETVLSV